MKNVALKFLLGTLVLGVIVLFVAAPSSTKGGSSAIEAKANDIGNEFDAMVASHSIIKKVLKAPSSAEFPSKSEHTFTTLEVDELKKGKVWQVEGYVDSQNAFGVMIRSYWVVGLLYYEGEYLPATVEFDGKKIYP